MSDIVPYTPPATGGWVELLAPAAELARQIANTEFVPGALRGNPAKVTACVLFGAELGIGPMQSLAKVDIIDGRPAPKAELARALVLGAGHEMWVENQTNTAVTVAGRRKGSDIIQRITWTMDDAKRAGLDGKQNWRKWPRQMLVARASAELARMSFPDCLGGISAFVEEIDDDQIATPATGPLEATVAPKSTRARRLTPAAATGTLPTNPVQPAPAPANDLPPLPDEVEFLADEDEPGEDAATPITGPQVQKLAVMFGKLDVTDRDDRLNLCQSLTGRTLTSSKDLTKHEASAIIDRLTQVESGTAEFIFDDGKLNVSDVAA